MLGEQLLEQLHPMWCGWDAGGEEQWVLRGNPAAWGCQREEGVTPQDKKQGVVRHLGW